MSFIKRKIDNYLDKKQQQKELKKDNVRTRKAVLERLNNDIRDKKN